MGYSSGRRRIHTITAPEMREINRSAVLELIRCEGPLARSQIAEALQVSLPTVMRIVDELVESQLVIEDRVKEWSGGRKRSRLLFNGAQHLVLGIDLGGTKIYGAVANLNGEIRYEMRYEHKQSQADESLELLCTVIDQLLVQALDIGLPVRGIGIGVPGIVTPDKGSVVLAPALNWIDFPLRERLCARYDYPIAIENDVNLSALGEMWFGSNENERNLVLLTIGTGVGAGIVINGVVYSGSHNMAGEVGYILPDRSFLGQSYSGFGALEQLVSGTGIAEQARRALRDNLPAETLEALTAEDVFETARRYEPWAVAILDDVIDSLVQLVVSVTSILDPDVILLGGGVIRSKDLLLGPIRQRLEGLTPRRPEIRVSKLGYRAATMGAIIRLLRITSDYYLVQKFNQEWK